MDFIVSVLGSQVDNCLRPQCGRAEGLPLGRALTRCPHACPTVHRQAAWRQHGSTEDLTRPKGELCFSATGQVMDTRVVLTGSFQAQKRSGSTGQFRPLVLRGVSGSKLPKAKCRSSQGGRSPLKRSRSLRHLCSAHAE